MATSGSFNTRSMTALDYKYPHYVTVSWSIVSTDISRAQTVINIKARAENTGYNYYCATNGEIWLSINGQTSTRILNYTRQNMFSNELLLDTNITVNHLADGNAKIEIYASFAIYYQTTYYDGSGVWQLPAITRGAIYIYKAKGFNRYIIYIYDLKAKKWNMYLPYVYLSSTREWKLCT